MKGDSLQRSRLIAATVFVTAAVIAVPMADTVFFPHVGASVVADAGAGFHAESILQAGSPEEALKAIEAVAAQSDGDVSDWFRAEVGFLPGARDVRVGNAGRVVGYVVDCDVDQALAKLEAHMEGLGWKGVSLGQVDGFTFIKPSGTCTWALVTCTQVASATSVVVRLK